MKSAAVIYSHDGCTRSSHRNRVGPASIASRDSRVRCRRRTGIRAGLSDRNRRIADRRYALTALKENVGRDGFYGHRICAAFSHLVNSDYVLYLDQDNWFDPDHVAASIETIERTGSDWTYSPRKICSRSGAYLFNDDCESLGKWMAWTNTATYRYQHVLPQAAGRGAVGKLLAWRLGSRPRVLFGVEPALSRVRMHRPLQRELSSYRQSGIGDEGIFRAGELAHAPALSERIPVASSAFAATDCEVRRRTARALACFAS